MLIHLCLQGFELLIGSLQETVSTGHLVLSSLQFDLLMQFKCTFTGFHDGRIGLPQRVDVLTGSIEIALLEVGLRFHEEFLGFLLGIVATGCKHEGCYEE